MTGAALGMTWHHFFVQAQRNSRGMEKSQKTHRHEAISPALNFPFLQEVAQNCFAFDVAIRNLRKSKSRGAFFFSFLKLSSLHIEEVSGHNA